MPRPRRLPKKPVLWYAIHDPVPDRADAATYLARFWDRSSTLPRLLAERLWPPPAGFKLTILEADRHPGVIQFGRRAFERRVVAGQRGGFCSSVEIHVSRLLARQRAGELEQLRHGDAGDVCWFCGCWEGHACPGGCWWAAPNLCSACCRRHDVDPLRRAQLEEAEWEAEVSHR